MEPVTVQGRLDDLTGVAASASQGRVGIRDLRLRPLLREGELFEAVPGMILTQHSGDGKSNQMFVRGFNLDHGTDFQTHVEGMPVNLPTHGHGHGYTDVNFLVPELVDYLEYRLGVYYPEIGDFGSAGGANVRLVRSLPRPAFRLEGGANGFARAVGAGSMDLGPGDLLVGGEVKGYDGPWVVPQKLRKLSVLGRYSWQTGADRFSVLAMTYRNDWNASDQIPRRAVDAGVIDRFGQVDSTLGGSSARHSLLASWQRAGGRGGFQLDLYGIAYELDLYSNFTYFLDEPDRGDQLLQHDDRVVAGMNAEWRRLARIGSRDHTLRLGFQGRVDVIDVALSRAAAREPYAVVRADDVTEWTGGLYAVAESPVGSKVRTVLGVRGDLFASLVRSDRAANSGDRSDAVVAPKASVVFGPWSRTEAYLAAGLGFHSNDARGTTISVDPVTEEPADPVDPIVLSRGVEIGARTAAVAGWRSTLALWWVELDSELRFVGDAGTTEPSDKSRRLGITWANFYRPVPRLAIELDVSFTRARYVRTAPGEDRVPGALENVIAAGVSWDPAERGVFGAVRLRHFGAHPLIEDNSVRGTPTSLMKLTAGYLFSGVRAFASAHNVLDAEDSDIQYYYASRRPQEPAGGVDDVHCHPVEPRQRGWECPGDSEAVRRSGRAGACRAGGRAVW